MGMTTNLEGRNFWHLGLQGDANAFSEGYRIHCVLVPLILAILGGRKARVGNYGGAREPGDVGAYECISVKDSGVLMSFIGDA